jgi:starch synthase (maltosyl-transferring)
MKKQARVLIENIQPQINAGDFPIKRVVGEDVHINADILADGHDVLQAALIVNPPNSRKKEEYRLNAEYNDTYFGHFSVQKQGYYNYYIEAWIDHALNWQHGIEAKLNDHQHLSSELLDGVQYLEFLHKKLKSKEEKKYILNLKTLFQSEEHYEQAIQEARSERLRDYFKAYPQKQFPTKSKKMQVYVDREKARFSTWYEFFPRSASEEEGQHGTFKDCERLLPKIASMGFDTLYFPPIHPIGEKNRKGKNNTTTAEDGDSGVPWAIGSKHGGHKSIHSELGTEKDFASLIKAAKKHGMEIAMDIALQAAPDHPYLTEHPEWFKFRPDGTIQYAENPPKKYQDIVNFNFESDKADELWKELLSIGMYWTKKGVRVFRVDNPHTKPFLFWNWFIEEIKKKYPDTLFLAEAFARPKLMQQLAKQGFSQSYTYFTWRVEKHELIDYVSELTKSEMKEYFSPNFWPNTPDINPYHLQGANEAMHLLRYALAATLSSNTGVYGPVYEYMETEAMPGKEEYANSEKYEIKHWDWSKENKITHLISKINHLRKEEKALQQTNNIEFCALENDKLIAYCKWDDKMESKVLIVVNLDPHYTQKGTVKLAYDKLGLAYGHPVMVHDLITSNTYHWEHEWNYVELHPALPFHIFKIMH